MSVHDSYPDHAIRDALFEHAIFNSKQRGSVRFGPDSFRDLEAAWPFALPDLLTALDGMRAEGLVDFKEARYVSTKNGRIARERRWQERGMRHPSLTSGSANLKDVLVALTMTGGHQSEGKNGGDIDVEELDIFLPDTEPCDLEKAIQDLIGDGVLKRGRHVMNNDTVVIALTPEGRRHYVQHVIGRLGIIPPRTILLSAGPERLSFDNLGLPDVLADNLRYRWEEAARCEAARAWLAANILYGSILEVILAGWLARHTQRALNAKSAPQRNPVRSRQRAAISQWTLQELISVAKELGLLDKTLERHADALRENRNLVHPNRQIKERSSPNGGLTAVSKQVVLAVASAAVAAR